MGTIKQFQSKRNQVALVENGESFAVRKSFTDSKDAAREAAVYQMLDGSSLNTARLLRDEDNQLLLSYMPGTPFVTLLDRQEWLGFHPLPWESLVDWLMAFHRYTGYVMHDLNLRNFLYQEEHYEVAGLDFEECRPGQAEDMLARLCACILSYDPPFSEVKKKIVRHIQDYYARRYLGKACDLSEKIDSEIQIIQERRRKK